MNRKLTEREEEVFCDALEIKSPGERNAFLDRECQGNAQLRASVERLLAMQPKAEKFFQDMENSFFR